ncbi:MAG: hypothetical protein QXD24_02095 [Candidatus Caldarchaeum sp.]
MEIFSAIVGRLPQTWGGKMCLQALQNPWFPGVRSSGWPGTLRMGGSDPSVETLPIGREWCGGAEDV